MKNYYNEYDKKASASLKQLIADGLIPNGDVDDRSIAEVTAGDLRGYTQHHFFCGVVGWSRALQLAGWPDTRPVWTGSCPCQPYSSAGKQKGAEDERDLWPVWFRLMRGYVEKVGDIPTVFGEQVASAIAHGWLDRVYSDMEGLGYAVGSLVFPACSVDAPHRRDRVGLVADAAGIGGGKREQNTGRRAAGIADKKQSIADKPCSGALGDTESRGQGDTARVQNRTGKRHAGDDLTTQALAASALWTTPSTRDHKDSPGMVSERKDGKSRHDQLPRQVFGTLTIGSSAATVKPGASPQLNPAFVFWLMGFPKEWVSSVQRGMQSVPQRGRSS